MLFVDHVITGHINAHRKEGRRKQSSLLGRHLMAMLGAQKGLANTYCLPNGADSVNRVLLPCTRECKRLMHDLNRDGMKQYRSIYKSLRENCASRGLFVNGSVDHRAAVSPECCTGSHAPIALHSARLTSLGSINMEISAPNEDDDSIEKDKIAQWREFAAFQYGKAAQALRTT